MDKGKIRVALAALSVAGLLAGLTVTGCKALGSCGSSCTDKGAAPAASSCTGGSCTGTMPAEKPAEGK